MHYIVYKTTNLINGKVYVGKHRTDSLEFDGYLGSGILLNRAILKYGSENFKRETLFVFDNPIDCSNKENEIVNEKFIERSDVYNIAIGGDGGNTIYGHDEVTKQEIYTKMGISIKKAKESMTDEVRDGYRERMRKIRVQPNNKNRKHTGKALQNIIDSNHMRGKKWFTNGEDSIALSENDEIPEGYYRGRSFTEDKKFKGHDKDTLEKLSKKRSGGNYYNNGIENIFICNGCEVPEGYYKGMKPRERKEKYSWFTNGVNNIGLYESDEIPEGYYKGRTLNNKKRGRN